MQLAYIKPNQNTHLRCLLRTWSIEGTFGDGLDKKRIFRLEWFEVDEVVDI